MNEVLHSFSGGKDGDFLLSFCIPTLNRPNEMRVLLTSLIPQLTSETELLIKDDSTSDETEFLVKTLLENTNISFRYFRGKKEGIDPANIFIAENARGKFVWWFGDDDELLPNAIARALAAINANPNLGFIWINFLVGGIPGLSARKQGPDKILKTGDAFLEDVGIDMTLLSTGIFRREAALPALPIAKKYVGSHFASQPLIFEAVSSGKETLVILEPYIVNHPTILAKGQGLFWDGVKTMGVAYFDILMEFKNKFSRRAIRKVLARNFGHIWRGLIIGWIRRDTEAPRRRIFELLRYWTYPEFYPAIFLFLLPKFLVATLLSLYKLVCKKSYLPQG